MGLGMGGKHDTDARSRRGAARADEEDEPDALLTGFEGFDRP